MSPPLRVPRQFITAFEMLGQLPEEQFDAVNAALATARPAFRVEALCASVKAAGATLPEEQLSEILGAVQSFTGLRRLNGWTSEEAVELLMSSPDLSTEKEPASTALHHRLVTLLESRPVQLLSKAIDVASEHDRVFIGTRILSDLRPLFPDHEVSRPEGVVLSHTLKVEFVHDDGSIGNVYIALDPEDLETLRVEVVRAAEKQQELKALMDELGLDYLGPEVE